MSRLPAVRDGALFITPDAPPIQLGSPEWEAWLVGARSFTFACVAGTFTARHEERAGRSFWYAYRQRAGVLRKVYLGRAADLTQQRLEQAAHTLAQQLDEQPQRTLSTEMAAWETPLIATKITIPQSGLALIERPPVTERLLIEVERPCALITAPAGSGKTTLVIQACEALRARGWRIAWVSLEATERDPVRFWAYALAALEGAQPGAGASAQRLLLGMRPKPIEQALTALVNALAGAGAPIALVLDDYHQAASSANDRGLTFLIEHAPRALHLLITARDEPALPLSRLRAQGRLAELHAADLRFSLADAERFLSQTMRLTLPPAQLNELARGAEGWVAGLQLAALSLREQSATLPSHEAADTASSALTTAPRYVAEYLIDEALSHQPKDVQAFLLQTSMLDRLCGPLCDAVTGGTDGAEMLARLTQKQLFIIPLDPARTWYRYHQLFAGALRERLARTEPETLRQCHLRAAAWLEAHDLTGEAISHLLAAKAFGDAARLIEHEGERLMLRGETVGLAAWAQALPRAALLAHPHLCVLYALCLLLQGEANEAIGWLETLREIETSPEILGEAEVVRAILTLISGDFFQGLALAREAAMQLPPTSHLLRGLALWIAKGIGVLDSDNLAEVVGDLEGIADECLRVGNVLVGFMALATKGALEIYQGRLHQAARSCREALHLAPRVNGQELPIAALAHCALGDVLREWNDLEGARDEIQCALTDDTAIINVEFLMDGLISLMLIDAERGDFSGSLATYEEVRRYIHASQLSVWDSSQAECMRARVLIMQGRIVEAAHWAEDVRRRRRTQNDTSAVALLFEVEDLTLARVSLAQGRADAAIVSLTALSEQATRGGRIRDTLEAEILLALAHDTKDEHEAALAHLDTALAIAAPEGFTRIFLDAGEPLAALLARYVASRPQTHERSYAQTLLAAFGRAAIPEEDTLAEALSAREIEVLRLLAKGRSNEAIARELVLALSTVKWHVVHIYRKLGVNGRIQAVVRARELSLIA